MLRKEVKAKVGEILKAERNADKVVALLKADTVLKVTDEEVSEVQDFLGLIPVPPPPDTTQLEKAQADAREAAAKAEAAQAELRKIADERHMEEVTKWVTTECPYLNMDVKEAATQIIKAEKVDSATAESLKKSFKSTSEALKASALFKETGSSGENHDPICGNLVALTVQKIGELRKSANGLKGHEIVADAIQSMGGSRYEQYRKEFNHRARTI